MNKVYEIVTGKIIAQLEKGNIPWSKPWKPTDAPRNAITNRRYSGINTFLLEAARENAGYASNSWLTFKQATELGGDVKGQKTTLIIFACKFEGTNKEGKTEEMFSLRYYNVFNTEQVSGVTWPTPETLPEVDPIEAAELVVENMQHAPAIKHGGDRAYYSPSSDYVQMPPRATFTSAVDYYNTLFHELGHSTGHKSRLGRFEANTNHNFGSTDYSKEELVAEMTAAFLLGATGLENTKQELQNAAYIQSWLQDNARVNMAAELAGLDNLNVTAEFSRISERITK